MDDGILCAYLLDGNGSGTSLGWQEIHDWQPSKGALWIHLDRTATKVQDWLYEHSGLPSLICDALLEDTTRPRCALFDSGALVNLRGINFHPSLTSDEMISIRLFGNGQRIISMARYPLLAVKDLQDNLASGAGPESTGALLANLADSLTERMPPVLWDIGEALDDLEELVETSPDTIQSDGLTETRRKIITLQRYTQPQATVLKELYTLNIPWLQEAEKQHLREISNTAQLIVEELNTAKERIAVLRDEVQNKLASQMNRTIYVLTILSALLLPLSVLTGLLGINVGGIPGSESPWAFALVAGGMAFLLALELAILRMLKWV